MRWLLAPLVAVLLVLQPAQPVVAAESALDFAVDGSAWSSAPAALLHEAPVLSPGGSVAPTLQLRSQRAELSSVVVALVRPRVSAPAAGGAFILSAQDEHGRELLAPARFTELQECTVLLSRRMLASETATVTIDVALDAALTGTDAQGSSVGFDIRVGMAAGVVPTGCPTDAIDIPFAPAGPAAPTVSAEGALPQTGAPLTSSLVVSALAMMVIGAALIAARRRREDRT